METAHRKTAPTKSKITVAEYITAKIDLCGKSQMEIAREAGFSKPNIITMIKQGKTKLPMAKIGVVAKAMGVDPLFMFQLCMNEYDPETWAAISEYILKQPFVTANEMEIIELVRSSKVPNPKVRTIEEKQQIVSASRPPSGTASDIARSGLCRFGCWKCDGI